MHSGSWGTTKSEMGEKERSGASWGGATERRDGVGVDGMGKCAEVERMRDCERDEGTEVGRARELDVVEMRWAGT